MRKPLRALACLLVAAATHAAAEEFPVRPVTPMMPYAAGDPAAPSRG